MVAGTVMASMASSPACALPLAANWEFNKDSGPMLDSSGNNNGTPKNVVQGVGEDIDGDGQDETTYRFNGLTTPWSRVEVTTSGARREGSIVHRVAYVVDSRKCT